MFRTRDNFLDPRHFTRDTRHAPIRLSRESIVANPVIYRLVLYLDLHGLKLGNSGVILYANMSRNKSQGIVVSFYHAIHAARLVQMPLNKKKRSCQFSSATARRRKPKKIV